MKVALLKAGVYPFGEPVHVTVDTLRAMVTNTPMPIAINVRHDPTKVAGRVTQLVVDGGVLFAIVDSLKLAPAFSVDPPGIAEISITGHEMIEPSNKN